MKRNILLFITLSLFSLALLQDAAEKAVITGTTTVLESSSSAQSITLSCVANSIKNGDEIAFVIGTNYPYGLAQQKYTFNANVSGSSVTFSVTLDTGGLYTIFLTRAGSAINTPQTVTQLVITKLSISSITGMIPPSGIYTNKQVEITLMFKKYAFQSGDKFIFYITGNASSKQEITLDSSFVLTSTTYLAQITFPVEGTYYLSIKRGESEVEQTGNYVVVDPSTNSKDKIKKVKPIYMTTNPLAVTIEVDAAGQDKIGFSLGTTVNSNWILTVASPVSKVEMNAPAFGAGIYNIFYQVKAESNDFVLQDIKQRVFLKEISEDTISKVEGTVKANADASIKITFAKQTLYDTDKIIFAIGESLDSDKTPMVLTNVDFTKTDHTQKVRFPKEGKYNLWIQRDAETEVKQTATGLEIIVASADSTPDTPGDDEDEDVDGKVGDDNGEGSSDWLNMSFMILTGLLLL